MLVLHYQREWALICKEGSYSQHGRLFTRYNSNVSRTVSCQESVVYMEFGCLSFNIIWRLTVGRG